MSACGAVLYMYDGEYEGECELPEEHGGAHWDGVLTWRTDAGGEVVWDSIGADWPPDR